MRRESQPGQKKSQEFAAREQLQYPQSTNEPRRQKRARVHRTRDQRLLHSPRWTRSSGRRGKPSGSTQGHPETFQRPPALLKEGRETKERPGRQDFQRSQRKDIRAVEAKLANKVSVNKSKQTLPLRRRPIKNICHNLILSSKLIATPRNQ